MEKVKSTLTEIPETMLTTLWAKAVETFKSTTSNTWLTAEIF